MSEGWSEDNISYHTGGENTKGSMEGDIERKQGERKREREREMGTMNRSAGEKGQWDRGPCVLCCKIELSWIQLQKSHRAREH